ncbi:MAG: PRC-barrel domain-containing protein [Candidatus Pacearchaeota archaeon]|nr:PRC-barrel domain-containing protein [Candidatus Pacearchaeota archaeon]
MNQKRIAKEIVGKLVVTKEGKRVGLVKDITFETRSGELIHLVLTSPTPYAQSLNVEQNKEGDLLIPFSSILAIGDFVVVSEEDMR